MNPLKILFLATSSGNMGDTNNKTGVWLEGLAAPYYLFKEAGATITIASPNGGAIPLDPKSQSIIVATPYTKRFLKDAEATSFIAHSIRLEEVKADDFDVAFLPGGYGCLWDLVDNKIVKQLLESFHNKNKIIGSVAHGAASLLLLQDEQGEPLIKGKLITSFSDSEEASTVSINALPFLLESKLLSLGALYSKKANYISYVVTDGNIITGQNPASSADVAKKIITLLQHNQFTYRRAASGL